MNAATVIAVIAIAVRLGLAIRYIYKEKKNKDLCTAARAIGMVVAFVLLIIIVTMH